jgi:hypothetical protein
MIKIIIPNNNTSERKYILDIIFNEFLGLNYTLKIGADNYEIILKNNKKLIIKDTFFNKYPNDLEYLKEENIPKSIKELDIFATCFFMLTRWEEYVNKTRDKHNRFPATASLAYKEGFLDRPIINELIEELKEELLALDNSLVFKEKRFELILTHDVDDILLFRTYKDLIRRVGGDLIRRKNPLLAIRTIWDYIQVRLDRKNDPYDTFDWLMDMSEEIGVKSHFFFMAEGKTSYDNRYKSDSLFVKELTEKIKNRGHHIGIHPTYDAYNDAQQLKKEKDELEENLDTKITFGREHYLRLEVPTTWQIWEDNGMEWDSTCGYADREGFRCGTGDEFSVFNILTREKLKLKEKPLIVMEVTLLSDKEIIEKVEKLKKLTKKYNSSFVLLWHNSNFLSTKINLKNLYKRLIDIC